MQQVSRIRDIRVLYV